MFAENLIGLGFFWSVSYIKSIPTHEKVLAVGESGPNATFHLIFLGLGWPWVGELVGFVIIFICSPTQHKLVHRNHPIGWLVGWFVFWLVGKWFDWLANGSIGWLVGWLGC